MKVYAAAILLAVSAPPSFAAPSLRPHDPDDQEGPGARALQAEDVAPGGEAPDPEARALQAGNDFSGLFETTIHQEACVCDVATGGYDHALHPSNSEISRGTDFSRMFANTNMSPYYCCGVGSHYSLYHWDLSRGTDFSYMFYNSGDVRGLDFSRWDVSSGTSFESMFQGTHLRSFSGDFNNWDVSRGTSFASMFKGTHMEHANLYDHIDLSGWDVSRGTSFASMFEGCSIAGDFSTWQIEVDEPSQVEDMFKGTWMRMASFVAGDGGWLTYYLQCPLVKVRQGGFPYQPESTTCPWNGFMRICPGLCQGKSDRGEYTYVIEHVNCEYYAYCW